MERITTFEYNLSNLGLSSGSHQITVIAKADGYEASSPSNAVTYTLAMLGGTWRFNETLHMPSSTMEQEVTFTSSESSTQFTSLKVGASAMSYAGDSQTPVYVADYGGWASEVYRIIRFGDAQAVEKGFYEWFIANATPIEE